MIRSKAIDVSIILACYNEGETLDINLLKLIRLLNSLKLSWEIISIDDLSQDYTYKTLQKFSQKYNNFSAQKNKNNLGRGGTVIKGIQKSKGSIVGFIDIDLEISEDYIPKFINDVKDGSDIVLAKRSYATQININSILRGLASKIYRIIVKLILGLKYKDTEAGYKFFNKQRILPVLKKVNDQRWFFDTEVVARGSREGLIITEVDVEFHRRSDKKSSVRLVKDSLLYLKAIINYKLYS